MFLDTIEDNNDSPDVLKQFIELWEKYQHNPRIKPPMLRASHCVATSVGKGPCLAQMICALYEYVSCFRTLPPISWGKHHAHPSLLNNEQIAQAMCHYLKVLTDGKIMPLLLMKQVSCHYPIIRSQHCGTKDLRGNSMTMAYETWKLGYELKEVKNDERLKPIEPQLGPGEKLHIPIMHDESIIHANDLQWQVYIQDRKMPLWKKGQGQAIHVSDIIVEQTGQLTLSEHQLQESATLPENHWLIFMDACKIINPGKNHDGFWTNEKFVEQVSCLWVTSEQNNSLEKVKMVITIFEQMYPNAIAEFVFNQSSAHGTFAKDALNVEDMNIQPGGKQ
ncbi:hypothetical protein PAXRUDRAFT_24716 [Paxillus rubicundulus Ve08.2h10]|uniref:Uncharacterized protein n=1 Tax=Paxillus rubicundulus Ve08.2h10 TaxID=930991 RepID=A0A0D0DGU9_9AGAM|nr:hypothetical protein PAXRUDRAFT_24716 [Paxillus rubicundulus Ve08.2h10]